MAAYLAINLVVSALVVGGLVLFKKLVWNRTVVVTLILLLLTTAVFDSAIIAAGIVAYNPDKLLGFYVGKAPIEDFFYAVIVAVLVPSLWKMLKGGKRADSEDII